MDASLLHVGPRAITRDELDTLFKEASSIINNTPLYHVSDNPNDPFPISPSTLISLKDNPNPPPIESFSEADLLAYGKMHWRPVQQLTEQFWHAWHKHYFATSVQVEKELKKCSNWKCLDCQSLVDLKC